MKAILLTNAAPFKNEVHVCNHGSCICNKTFPLHVIVVNNPFSRTWKYQSILVCPTCLCSVVVIMWVLHTQGPWFNSRQRQIFFIPTILPCSSGFLVQNLIYAFFVEFTNWSCVCYLHISATHFLWMFKWHPLFDSLQSIFSMVHRLFQYYTYFW